MNSWINSIRSKNSLQTKCSSCRVVVVKENLSNRLRGYDETDVMCLYIDQQYSQLDGFHSKSESTSV